MSDAIDRRTFLSGAGTALAAGFVSSAVSQADEKTPPQPRLKKAVKIGMVQGRLTLLEKFELLKKLGYDGVELNAPSGLSVDEVLAARDRSGLPVHGVVDSAHWKQTLSHPEAKVRERGVAALMQALRDAKAYGASSVLLVPAVVDKQVTYGEAYARSQAEIRKAIPLAEKLGIRILLENVWNNFLLSPLEAARYIDELDSPMVGAYFDVGNVVRFGWPEHWILALGPRIGKLDIKEYSRKLQNSQGPWAGFRVKIGEGDCDWPSVLAALRKVGYQGWATAEVSGGDAERLADIKARMDRVLG